MELFIKQPNGINLLKHIQEVQRVQKQSKNILQKNNQLYARNIFNDLSFYMYIFSNVPGSPSLLIFYSIELPGN